MDTFTTEARLRPPHSNRHRLEDLWMQAPRAAALCGDSHHDTQTTQRLKLHPMLRSLTSPPHHPPRNSLFLLSPPSQPQVFRRIRHISFPNHLQSFKPGLETNVWRCVGHREYKTIHRKCNPCTLLLSSLLTWPNYLNICVCPFIVFSVRWSPHLTIWILSVCMSLALFYARF